MKIFVLNRKYVTPSCRSSTKSGPGPRSGPSDPGNLYSLPPPPGSNISTSVSYPEPVESTPQLWSYFFYVHWNVLPSTFRSSFFLFCRFPAVKSVIPYAMSASWISVTQFWLLLSGCQLQGASPYFSWHMSWWLSITNMACIRAPLTDSTRFVWIVCNEATGPQLQTTGSGSKCHCHCGLSIPPPVLSRSCRL